jgi:ribosomal-protein-alanine N-acetyltransferase
MIREISLKDEKEYYYLGQLLNNDFQKLFKLEDEISKSSSKIFIYDDNKVLGFIEIDILPDYVDIINIVVNPNFRNIGIGNKLIDYVWNKYKKVPLNIEVSINNINALRFYEKLGFIKIGVRHGYYNGVDAVRMVKEK